MRLCFPDEIVLRDAGMRGGSRLFRLVSYYRVITSLGTATIPGGFITDGASVPQVFWNILSPFGEYFPAALLHDYLYSKASTGHFNTTRKQADDLFLESMFNLGVPWHTRHIIHSAVRAFGWRAYKKDWPCVKQPSSILVKIIESQNSIITKIQDDVDRMSKGCGAGGCVWGRR